MTEWISVEDRLPEPYKNVLAWLDRNMRCMIAHTNKDGDWFGEELGEWIEPSHWIALPDPPKEKP